MINVNVKQLIEAIEDADVFKLPNVSRETEYLYSNRYRPLNKEVNALLSELDFDSFLLEDLEEMEDLHSNILEASKYKTNTISRALRESPPASATLFA